MWAEFKVTVSDNFDNFILLDFYTPNSPDLNPMEFFS
uniref:Uncharacterized protein n=1 Tax=Lepeophtheirus salmonis TaxID=72036 RepID=A0A0K2U4P6_LEPSM